MGWIRNVCFSAFWRLGAGAEIHERMVSSPLRKQRLRRESPLAVCDCAWRAGAVRISIEERNGLGTYRGALLRGVNPKACGLPWQRFSVRRMRLARQVTDKLPVVVDFWISQTSSSRSMGMRTEKRFDDKIRTRQKVIA